MCGIVGLHSSKPGNQEERLRKALDIQKHRGPDDSGLAIYRTHNVYLGQNRLSIIDLSNQGHQPFECSYKNFTYSIVYNGEVYNYLELRRILISNGYNFRSASDTEVILYAYIHWGVECVNLFRGMFAFTIWDSKNEFLFVARDRFGIKPFVYSVSNGEFAFASEVKTLLLLTNGYDSGLINSSSIIDYFTFGSVRQPNTLYKNIFWLPKAHYGIYHRGELTLVKYWDLAQNAKNLREEYNQIEYEEAKSILLQKLEEATKLHMISDVKVGAFLSGGIDSTAVVALMARCHSDKIDTYTLGFDLSNDVFPDETQIAQRTSLILGTNHHALKLTKENFLEKLPKFFASSDQPSIDGLNTYIISEFVPKEVKVLLSGLGGDELFLGYNYCEVLAELAPSGKNNITFSPDTLAFLGKYIPRRYHTKLLIKFGSSIDRLLTIRRYILLNDLIPIAHDWGITKGEIREYAERIETELAIAFDENIDLLDNVSIYEFENYIPNTLLRDSDVMAMRHSKEIRPILLDHPLVEFCCALPVSFKFQKRIFKDCLGDLIPPFVKSAKKFGFELPFEFWLRETLDNFAREKKYPRKYAKNIFFLDQFFRYQNG